MLYLVFETNKLSPRFSLLALVITDRIEGISPELSTLRSWAFLGYSSYRNFIINNQVIPYNDIKEITMPSISELEYLQIRADCII